MTQGDEQRHGVPAGEFQRNLELSHRADTTISTRNGTSSIQAVSEMLLPPCLHRPSTNSTSHGGEDAKNLLQFVHHASCDIKAALDQGSYPRKQFRQHLTSSHRSPEPSNDSETLMREHSPVRRFSAESMLPHHLQRHNHHHSSQPPPPHYPRHHHLTQSRDRLGHDETPTETDDAAPHTSRDVHTKRHGLALSFADRETENTKHTNNESVALPGKDVGEDNQRVNVQEREESMKTRSKTDTESMDLFSYVDLLRQNSLKQAKDDDHSENESSNESEAMSIRENLSDKKMSPMDENDKNNKINTVPLRKRRLPASFWQEPKGKSENHRIVTRPTEHTLDGQPRSFVHHPGLSLFGQLKLPVPSPLSPGHLDFDFGLGRHFCGGDKNPFVYPSTSTSSPFLNLNLPYHRPSHVPLGVPHATIDDRHRHGLHVPCGSNVCMCHLQNLPGYSSSVCEASSQGASGLFGRSPTIPPVSPMDSTPSSALALNRWSAMQTLEAAPTDLLGGYPMPRVLKPIPTKSLTSYPPRFHPIFT